MKRLKQLNSFHSLRALVTISALFTPFFLMSQSEIKITDPGVSVNDNGVSTPDPSAVFDVNSDSKGVVFPRLTNEQRDAIENPVPGLLIFNADNCVYEYFNGSTWQAMGLLPVQDVPNSPSNLVASISGSNSITLNWSDDSDNESGFEIWYKTSSTNYSKLTNTGSNITQYTHSNLSDELYTYKIKAVNGCTKSDFTAETEGTLILNFKAFGPTEWEFPVYDLSYFNYDQSYFDATGRYKILSWSDVSGNNHDVIFDLFLVYTNLISHRVDGTDLGLSLPRNVLGRVPNSAAHPLAKFSDKSLSNFLHQGNESYTLFFEFIATSALTEMPSTLTFTGTGNYQRPGLEIFFRNNYPSFPSKRMEVRMWNWYSNLVTLRSEVGSVKEESLNQVMITFNATTRELTLYLNGEDPISAIVTDNFQMDDSFIPFSLYSQVGNRATQLSGIGSSVCWRGSVLNQQDFNHIKNTSKLYYRP